MIKNVEAIFQENRTYKETFYFPKYNYGLLWSLYNQTKYPFYFLYVNISVLKLT
jgi:hypothetical protein